MEGFLQGSQQPGLIYSPSRAVCAVPPCARFLSPRLASCWLTRVSQCSCSEGHVKGKPALTQSSAKDANTGEGCGCFHTLSPGSGTSPAGRKVGVGCVFWGICQPALPPAVSPRLPPALEQGSLLLQRRHCQSWGKLSSFPPFMLFLPAGCKEQHVRQPQSGKAWDFVFQSQQKGCMLHQTRKALQLHGTLLSVTSKGLT